MKVRELPRYEGIAPSMTDFFVPEDASDSEVLVRRGKMVSCAYGSVECLMMYTTRESEWGFNLAVFGKIPDDSNWYEDTRMYSNPEFEKILKTFLQP